MATESLTDSEAVQRTMEQLAKTTQEFREADMRRKLKECQGLRTQAYQHMRDYVEGDKVWYQPLNGNSWLGPASVLCQRGQSVWIHTNGDIKKVAACKTKPYELLDLEPQNTQDSPDSQITVPDSQSQGKKQKMVMLEDGLSDGEDVLDPEEETRQYAMEMIDTEKDSVGAQYLKVVNHMSFSDYALYTVELPVSKHNTPEVKEAKMTEVSNLQDYDVFEEVKDEGQDTIGSRWVVTEKEKHDGQKQQTKARLVAHGFQETLKPQSDSPTVSKESLKPLWP